MDNNFAKNLRALRESKSFTLEQVGKMIGVSKQTVSKYEKGISNPDSYTLSKLANVFSCSIDSLLFDNISSINLNKIDDLMNKHYDTNNYNELIKSLEKQKDKLIKNISNAEKDLLEIENFIKYIKNKCNLEMSNELSFSIDNIINIDDYSKSEKAYIDIGFYKENDVQIYYPKESNENTYRIPVVGYISAGCPHWAFENISNHLNISKDYLGCYNKYFILKVAGESMNEIYKNKDYILVDGSQNIVSSNTPVIALVDNDEATVKYIYIDHENNTFTLIPKSSDNTFEPITYSFERHSLKILGTVLGVVNYANSIK